ncbi:hypothetical protein [Cupriavidus campinensis]
MTVLIVLRLSFMAAPLGFLRAFRSCNVAFTIGTPLGRQLIWRKFQAIPFAAGMRQAPLAAVPRQRLREVADAAHVTSL